MTTHTTPKGLREVTFADFVEVQMNQAALDPFSWEPGDPIPEHFDELLDPAAPGDKEAVRAAWEAHVDGWVDVMSYSNAIGVVRFIYGMDVDSGGRAQARWLMAEDVGGSPGVNSVRVSDDSEHAILVEKTGGVVTEGAVVPASGHPLRALLFRLIDDLGQFTLEPVATSTGGDAWELRLGEPDDYVDDIAEHVQSQMDRHDPYSSFSPGDWTPGDPVPEHIVGHLIAGAALSREAVLDAYWDWVDAWAYGKRFEAQTSYGDDGVSSVRLTLLHPDGGKETVSTDSPFVEASIPSPDGRSCWTPTRTKKGHPLTGVLDVLLTVRELHDLRILEPPKSLRQGVEVSSLPDCANGHEDRSASDTRPPTTTKRKARRKAQKASRRRNRKAPK